jgi:hypothetical protein
MADLVDKGEAELQQLTQKVTMTTTSASLKASVWVGKGVAAAPFKAVAAIYRSLEQSMNKQRESGQVSLKAFTQIAEGKRELVSIDDRAVAKELERELRRHGVVWSVETHRDGSRTFHVQGKDAELIQHALTVAAERVDEKLARNAPELRTDAATQSAEQQQETPEVRQERPAEPERAPEQSQAATPVHGTDELREDAPDLGQGEVYGPYVQDDPAPALTTTQGDGAVTDRGGHSIEQQPAITRSEQRPEPTPRDRTRAHAAEKIDKNVKQRKSEIEQTKTRAKKRTPARSATDDPQAHKSSRR